MRKAGTAVGREPRLAAGQRESTREYLGQVCLNHSAEPSPGLGRMGSVGCAHGRSLSKVLLETSISGGGGGVL